MELDRSALANWGEGVAWRLGLLQDRLVQHIFSAQKLFVDDTLDGLMARWPLRFFDFLPAAAVATDPAMARYPARHWKAVVWGGCPLILEPSHHPRPCPNPLSVAA
ncbi:MAG: hypothetical protein JSR91_19485 [Proteobacteria bacterium]|nr:hypothetical protein [Pseudomonadota bacterium]